MVVHFDLFGGFLKNWLKGLPLFHEPQNTLRVWVVFQVVFVKNIQRHTLLPLSEGKGQQLGQAGGTLKILEEAGKEVHGE